MAEEQKQPESSKTLVSFVVGLLIGGMLVWAFSGSTAETVMDEVADVASDAGEMVSEGADAVAGAAQNAVEATEEVVESLPNLPVGNGTIVVDDQAASREVAITRATYPINEGWVGVRQYNNGQLGFILGVVQFSAEANIVPKTISLQSPTTPGREYAVVVFESDGTRGFNAAGDVQVDEIFATFTAQ